MQTKMGSGADHSPGMGHLSIERRRWCHMFCCIHWRIRFGVEALVEADLHAFVLIDAIFSPCSQRSKHSVWCWSLLHVG